MVLLFKTICIAPAAAPSNVTFTSTTTSITFTWDEIPCGSRGGSITYEYVFDSNNGTSKSTSETFNQLRPCSSYRFKVRAKNEAGHGLYSSEVIGETQDESKYKNVTMIEVISLHKV